MAASPIPSIISEAVANLIPSIIVLEVEEVVDPIPFINLLRRGGDVLQFPIIPFIITLEVAAAANPDPFITYIRGVGGGQSHPVYKLYYRWRCRSIPFHS